jgi:uncharacterized protein with PQ loop repeat
MTEWIGWSSSLVLLATIVAQLSKQWRERTTRGVSHALFFGQAVASFGFTWYSIRLGNWVFAVTNGLLLLSALVGCVLTLRYQKPAKKREGEAVA